MPELPPFYGKPIDTPTGHKWAGTKEAADFLANRPHYDRQHVSDIDAAAHRRGTPYCWECHDWHHSDEEHSTAG